jgi:hypothetical protein
MKDGVPFFIFFPGKGSLRGQPDGEREDLCLPRLGKDRPVPMTGQARQGGKATRGPKRYEIRKTQLRTQ